MEDNNSNKSLGEEKNSKNSNQNEKDSNSLKDQKENISLKEKEENKEIKQDENNPNTAINTNNNLNINLMPPEKNNDKGKRKRRGKNEVSDRQYKCPDCPKSYLSLPALTIHRKIKHSYIIEAEGKLRGRPKKELQQENSMNSIQIKYNEFFKNETRRQSTESDGNNNDNLINSDIIKNNLIQIYKQCKSEILFSIFDKIEDYTFYKVLVEKWDKENPEICNENNNEKKKENTNNNLKNNSPILDDLFFMYLKEVSKKTNKDYFWFINKFIVLFREFINISKNEDEKNKEYTQAFGAEGIPEICNDFFLDFMEPKEFFGLNNNELIQLTQHFCFWLYTNKYSHSYLTLI